MSFWRTFGFHTVSPVDTLLEKPDVTLQELLDEDELLQECKSQNKRLIDFLTDPEILTQIVAYLTENPPADADEKRTLKFPFLCCEVLCSEVWPIVDAFYKHESLLPQLFSFLQRDEPLNPLLSNYCCKVAMSFMQRKIAETLEYMKSVPDMVHMFVQHLSSPGVNELLEKIVSADGAGAAGNGPASGSPGADVYGAVRWLVDNRLVEELVNKFVSIDNAEEQETISQALIVLVAITTANAPTSLIVQKLESEDVLSTLLRAIFAPPASSASSSVLLHGIPIVSELLRRLRGKAWENTPFDDLPYLVRAVIEYLPQCQEMLKPRDANEKMDMTFGELRPPVGLHRLQVLGMVLALLNTTQQFVADAIVASSLLEPVIEMFFAYPWNTFLHQIVTELFSIILTSPNRTIILQLLKELDLPGKIVKAELDSQAEQDKLGPRGYIGHITKISVMLQRMVAGSEELNVPPDTEVGAILEATHGWKLYVENPLAERLTNESQLLGGSKPVAPADMTDPEDLARGGLAYHVNFASAYSEADQDRQEIEGDGDIEGGEVFDPSDGFSARPAYASDDRFFNYAGAGYDGGDGSSGSSSDDDEYDEDDEDDEGEEDEVDEEADELAVHTANAHLEDAAASADADAEQGQQQQAEGAAPPAKESGSAEPEVAQDEEAAEPAKAEAPVEPKAAPEAPEAPAAPEPAAAPAEGATAEVAAATEEKP